MKTQNQFLLSVAIALGFLCAAGAMDRMVPNSTSPRSITYVSSNSYLTPSVDTTHTVVEAPEVESTPESMPVSHVSNASEATPITYCHRGYNRWEYRRGQPVRNVVRFFHNRRPIRSWIRNGDGPIRRFFRNGGFFRRGWFGCR
jgi:hypothetical protein